MTDPLAAPSESVAQTLGGESTLGSEAVPALGSEDTASEPPEAAIPTAARAPSAVPPISTAAPAPSGVAMGARQIVSQGLDLSLRATPQLRGASIYFGLQLMALAGPLVILAAVAVSRVSDLSRLATGEMTAAELSPFENTLIGLIFIGAIIVVLGFAALAIDSQIIAASLLAGRLTGRPLTLTESVIRARQTFWRLVRAAFIVGIPPAIVGFALGFALQRSFGRVPVGANLATSFANLIVISPFCYALTGIVLGDVGAIETLKRSVRLARARWRVAFVIAIFAAAMGYIEVFASGAGGDILYRLARIFGLGFDHGSLTTFVTILMILVGSLAFGSLLFTVYAIVAAPQVVAFVGLTAYTEGLDRARAGHRLEAQPVAPDTVDADPGSPAPAGPAVAGWSAPAAAPMRFRWVTIPMAIGVALSIVISIGGIGYVLSHTY